MSRHDDDVLVAKIPADVDQPDKIVYGLTARQLAVLVVTGLAASGLYLAVQSWLPFAAVVASVLPVVAVGCVVAVARRDGMSLDRYVLAALKHIQLPRARVTAGDEVGAPPGWCRMRGRPPAPLRLPVRAIRQDGVMDLVEGGVAVMVRAGTIPFGLRTSGEQAALVAVFGRWLNSLESPVQILVRTQTVDLSYLVQHFAAAATGLADPALQRAAQDHAGFLAELNGARDLLIREVLVVLRDGSAEQSAPVLAPWARSRRRNKARDAGAAVVMRQAEEAARVLAVLGLTTEVLDGAQCAGVLAGALSPGEPQLVDIAGPGEVITAEGEVS
ncbi:PrgI family protein [Actinomadura sp. 21ATH]|uniref:PrgI family protein n=1 Tax=Actinomadura sp. 21ATH TaxID=1735444 RepID=UPI0035C0077E